MSFVGDTIQSTAVTAVGSGIISDLHFLLYAFLYFPNFLPLRLLGETGFHLYELPTVVRLIVRDRK